MRAFLLLCITGILMATSLFKCKAVHSYEEMADVRLGLPMAFVAANLQRYTPLEYPQCFRVGNPWEDPMRIMWAAFAVNLVLVFAALYGASVVIVLAWRRLANAR